MSILEDKIKKNRSNFDQDVPKEGHERRFAQKLDQLHPETSKSGFSFNFISRVAAIFVVMISVSLVVIISTRTPKEAAAANELPVELREAQIYYNQLAEDKIDKIAECAVNEEEAQKLRSLAQEEIHQIDEQTKELESEYFKNAENEKIESALISNYKSKSEILDNILDRLCRL
jgi:hypothetical protein